MSPSPKTVILGRNAIVTSRTIGEVEEQYLRDHPEEVDDYIGIDSNIREALRDWKQKRDFKQVEIEELRHLWQEGLESGNGRFSSMEDIKAEAKKRFAP